MSLPTNTTQLQPSDWIQIVVAIGQIASGLGALCAAFFAYRSTREMRVQSEVLRSQFISQYGPQIFVEYILENHLDSEEYIPEFPCNDNEVDRLQDGDRKRLFQLLCRWWNHPARNGCVSKYVVVKIHNTQADRINGVARGVIGTLKIEAKLLGDSFPSNQLTTIEFNAGDIKSNEIKLFPIRIEGIPAISIKFESIKYYMGSNSEPITEFSGQTLYRYPAE